MIPFILLFILLPTVIQGCLVVRAPKCECYSLALDSSNIRTYVGYHPFYKNVSSYPITAPKRNVDGCSLSMSCEGEGLTLVVFEIDKVISFGAYSVDGFCVVSTQSWKIVNGSGFIPLERVFGVCVDYSANGICQCSYKVMDSLSAFEIIPDTHPEYQELITADLEYPNVTLNDDGCVTSFECARPGAQRLVVGETRSLNWESGSSMSCNRQERAWDLVWNTGDAVILRREPFLFLTCKVVPLPEVDCACPPLRLIDSSNAAEFLTPYEQYMGEWFKFGIAKPEIGWDVCAPKFDCPAGYEQVVYSESLQKTYTGGAQLVCDANTKRWNMIDGQTVDSYPFALITCMNRNDINPDEPECSCPQGFIPTQLATRRNWLQQLETSDDHCTLTSGKCLEDGVTRVEVDGVETTVAEFLGVCQPDNNKWYIVVFLPDGQGQVEYNNQNELRYGCL